jgi:gliding motility-associated-like protein
MGGECPPQINLTRYPIRVRTLHAMTYTSFCKYFVAFLFFFFSGYNGYAYTKSQAGVITATDSITNVSCNGGSDGSIDLTVSGPNTPFTFLWSNNETTEDITNLVAGNYAVTIFDALGDSLNLSFVVSEPLPITISSSINSVACFGGNDGAISLTVSGGTGSYSYQWSNGESATALSNLFEGAYTVTITDSLNCFASDVFNVNQPSAINILAIITNLTCNNGLNGAIDVSVSGGTGSYSYSWSSGELSEDLSLIGAGNYTLTVTDANGCTNSSSFVVIEPALINIVAVVNSISCFGNATGAIDISAIGGTGVLNYLWSDGSVTEDLNGVIAGLYTLTITDANGCLKDTTIEIVQNTEIVITGVVTDVTCNSFSDGAIQSSATGGSGVYTFTWDNSVVSQNLTALTANNYSLTVLDNLGCEAQQTFTVSEPSIISINSVIIDATCFGLSNGEIALTSNGGAGNYSYQWSNASVDSVLQNIVAGNYSVVVTDVNGCTSSESFTINQPDSLILSGVVADAFCNGSLDGSMNITTAGGTSPFTYQWSNGSTTEDIASVPSGVYTVTVTDNNNCSASTSFTINQPDVLTLSLNSISPTCGASNGSISATVSGGVSPYAYAWSNSSTSSSLANLASGSYTLTITDINGCTANQTAILINQTGPSITSGITADPLCNGGSNGTIDISIAGGVGPFSYNWSNGQTSQDANGLAAGNYTVLVTDANNCTVSATFTISEPTTLGLSLTSVNPTCGSSNGSISSTVSGGVSPYAYAWSNSSISSSLANLASGSYTLTITDINGCTANQTAILINQTGPSITSGITTDPLCNGGSNGAIDISIAGGSSPITYNWSSGQTSQDANGLTAGNYTVVVTDANNCTVSNSYIVNQPTELSATINTSSTTCSLNNGSATVNAIGGTGALTYLWNNSSTSSTINNLAVGNYTATITDLNGCLLIRSGVVSASLPPTVVQNSITNVACFGDSTGAITISVNFGLSPFTFVWSNGATSQNIANLKNGSYTVTVTDANGCTNSKTFTVTQSTFLSLANFNVVNATCGQANGSAQIIPSGAVSPYTYLWSNGSTTNQIVNVGSGTYSVTVTDANGCTRRRNIVISNTNGPALTQLSQSNVNCFGASTGSIDISITGGVLPYTFSWSNGAISEDVSGLTAGDYTVTVTDANNCTATELYTITQLTALTINATVTNVGCVANSGSVSTNVTGGTTPYTYNWNNGITTASINSLGAGNYSLTVTDINGCTALWSGAVVGSGSPSATFTVNDVTCFGLADGSIASSTSGGNPPYSYLWNNGSTTSGIINLAPGNYTVTITDQSGCTAIYSNTVSSPQPISISPTIINVNCFNGNTGSIQLNVTGGTTPYSYFWNTGAQSSSISNLNAGSYSVTVTDSLNCTKTGAYNLSQNSIIQVVSFVVTNNNCNGGSNGAINIAIGGGSGSYTYLWSNGATAEDISNLVAGSYTLTVTDNLGCSNSFTYTVTDPTAITATTSAVNTTCSQLNGSSSVSASGGTGALTYLWNTGATTSVISSIGAGTYTVTITDLNGCSIVRNVTLVNQAGPSITSSIITDPLCNGGSNGSINISISGGTPLLNYNWSNGQTIQDANGLVAGTYTVTISDANNCTATGSYVVSEPSAITASFTSTPSTCNQNNGTLTVLAVGGTPGYTYLWNNGNTSSTINNLLAGNYTVTITDSRSCTSVQSASVLSQPSPIVVQNSLTNVLCNGDSTGAISISVNGGTAPLSFLWSNGETTQNIANLTNGSYTVTVTDANGCTGAKSFFISQPTFLSLANFSIINSTCGQANGSVLVNPVGGVSPYSYLWNTGSIVNQITNVVAGNYTLTVTDANGCTRSRNFVIQNTNGPVLTLSNQTNVSCYAGANGALDILVTAGVSPYTYLWSNGAVTQDISNITAGDYTVTITDANGCVANQQFTVTQNDSIVIQSTIVDANCGQNSGSISLNVSGGTSPYSYNWSSGGTSNAINNLIAGTYSVTITDGQLCVKQGVFVIADIAGPSIILDTLINSTCHSQALGAIQISIANGTTPYSYQWSNGITSQDNLNIVAGAYTVTVTDVKNCVATATYSISQPTAINAIFNVTNANCNLSNGSATVIASGGVGGYSYLWSNGVVGNTISNQSLGNYSVIITDASNCAVVDSVNIFNSGQATVSLVTQINPICNGSANGQLTVTVVGGLGPYQLLWSNGGTAYSNTNLAAGNYILTVTDITGCSSQTSYTLVEPDPLAITFVSSDEHCGQSDGSVSASIIGGNGLYTYSWSNGSSSSLITGLSNGSYTLTVTDILGCSSVASQTVNNIAAPVVSQIQITDAICYGSATGIINITVQGGIEPYTYLWSNNEIVEDVVNVSAGSYSVTVTDNFGCTVRRNFVVSQPDSIVISSMIDNAGCGNNNGEIMIAVVGGVGPYTYNWSNGLTNDTIQNLFAGVYSVIVADNNNCITQETFAVNNISSTNIILDSILNVSCNNQSNGSIYLSIGQGEPPFNYEWSTGATTLNLTNQPAGQYVLTVTDNNGCISIYIDTITQPDPIQLLSFVINPKCNLSNGDISVVPAGGTLPYTYSWNTGQTSSTIAGLNTGTYTLTVTDINGCTSTLTDSIFNSGSPSVTLVQLDSVSCNGLSDGNINVDVNGGVSPYTYQWVGTSQNTEDISNIPAGGYSLIVTDDVGCTYSESYTVYQPIQIQVNLLAVQNASCGSNNGSAVVNASGGSGNFNYYWSNATNNDTLFNVGAGSYTLVAVDGSGCSSSIIVNVSNINGPVIANVDSGNVTCPDVNDGFISISITGGTQPYQFAWSNLSDTTTNVINLTGGNYTLTVTDALNCIAVRTVTIDKPQPIAINGFTPSLNSPYNLSCFNSDDGSIVLNVSGGTSPYNYVWSNGNISQNISSLQAGTYTVYLTDKNGCTKDSTFFITQPPQLLANAGTDFNVCGQTQTNLSATLPSYGIGGWVLSSGPSTILFADSTNNTSLLSNLTFGDYQLLWVVSDGVCSDSDLVIVNVSSEIIAQAGSDKILCGNQISLNSTRPQFGFGYWSDSSSAIIADTTDPFTSVSNLSYGINVFNWIVVNGTCRDTGTVKVFVRDSIDCLDPVLLPNAFTPNNDGYNDFFEIKGIQDFLDNEITIFNRWGLIVYNNENYFNTWDGRDNNGNMLSDGTYFAVLKLRSINKFYKTYIDLRR